MTEISCLSLNHRVTPLDVRERVAFSVDDAIPFLENFKVKLGVTDALLLSTCNRTELYILGPGESDAHEPELQIAEIAANRPFEVEKSPRNYESLIGRDAVVHLFRVAGGLESQIVGESPILGQVRQAHAWSRAAGTDGRVLHRLWERALKVGKRIRKETRIGEGALSHATAALELGRKVFGPLRKRTILLIGAGEVAELALENIPRRHREPEEGKGGLLIANRTLERAEELADRYHGAVVDFDLLSRAIQQADFVISSTSAPEPIVDFETMKKIRNQRRGRSPLLIVDLAVPRDFDPRCATLDGIFLKNVDDLEGIIQANLVERREALPLAEAIIETESEFFFDWLKSLDAEPTILELRQTYERIRDEELELILKNLDEATAEILQRFSRKLINRLLHLPSQNLKRISSSDDREMVAKVHELLTREIPYDHVSPEPNGQTEGSGKPEARPRKRSSKRTQSEEAS